MDNRIIASGDTTRNRLNDEEHARLAAHMAPPQWCPYVVDMSRGMVVVTGGSDHLGPVGLKHSRPGSAAAG